MFTKTEYQKAIQYLRSRIVFKDFMSPSCMVQEKHRIRRKKNIPINESGPNKETEVVKFRPWLQGSGTTNLQVYNEIINHKKLYMQDCVLYYLFTNLLLLKKRLLSINTNICSSYYSSELAEVE